MADSPGTGAGGREPLLERLHFDLERGDLRLRRVALDREAAEDVAFSAELGKLAGVPVVELLNGRLGSPRRHREFRSQEIPVDMSVREWRWDGGFQPPRGQPYRAAVNAPEYGQPNEGGKQKANSEIHDGFVH
jgi:hypothetical protein